MYLLRPVCAPSSYLRVYSIEPEFRVGINGNTKWLGVRTIGRIPVALVVVYKRTRSVARVVRPARVENVLVLVLPQHSGWVEAFYKSDDDFVLLRESSRKTVGMKASGETWGQLGPLN